MTKADGDLISRADALEAKPEYRNEDMWDKEKSTYNKGWNDCNDAWAAIINALPSADRPTSSDEYKRGFEDAKRAFELEYARECENIRKRIAQAEVEKNMYKELADRQTDTISRAELFNKLAAVKAPPEANDYKTEVYRIINEMEVTK